MEEIDEEMEKLNEEMKNVDIAKYHGKSDSSYPVSTGKTETKVKNAFSYQTKCIESAQRNEHLKNCSKNRERLEGLIRDNLTDHDFLVRFKNIMGGELPANLAKRLESLKNLLIAQQKNLIKYNKTLEGTNYLF